MFTLQICCARMDDDVGSNRGAAAPTAAPPCIIHPSGSICFQTLVVYFNLDLVTGLEIAVDCFVAVSLEQLVPHADRMDPVLAYNNLRWHSLDRRGRNHLSDGLHRKLDLVSSTHCGKAKAEDGYCYEVAYSVHNIRVFERALACRRTKPTPPFGRSLSNRRLDLRGRTSLQKNSRKDAKSWKRSAAPHDHEGRLPLGAGKLLRRKWVCCARFLLKRRPPRIAIKRLESMLCNRCRALLAAWDQSSRLRLVHGPIETVGSLVDYLNQLCHRFAHDSNLARQVWFGPT